ncbi:MAG TPA: glycoside hydrolase family 15 protein [Acidobacteriaceae bacterium]|nr:glycoside hydrolase family 15 protein [Acidobacteriaceae bacterium]
MSNLAIADYALLSDCNSCALVSRAGSLDWLCFPRFDSPSVFGRLLDSSAGHWSIRPVGESTSERRYVDQTLVLETHFKTKTGAAVLQDALAVGRNERGHDLGADVPHGFLRRITCTRGEMEFEMEYAPRPEYGLVYPLLVPADGGVLGRGGAAVLLLSSGTPVIAERSMARARFTIRAHETICFALQYRNTSETSPELWPQSEINRYLDDTIEAWRSWSAIHQNYQGPWRDSVHLSGRVLQGLTFFPTGAMVAAPTTSLPEAIGGTRNWDYRYTWVRDASLTLEALWVAACPDEAHKFLNFLASTALTQVRRGLDLQIMFGIGGEHDLSEREIPHLSGWRGSRPVRVGNGAWNQRQLDVYGELLSAAYVLSDGLQKLDLFAREFLADLVDMATERWTQKDQGIWEIRGEPRDFLYSKLMCWVAVDRGIALAKFIGGEDRVARWQGVREQIRKSILEHGWNEAAGAFTQAYGSQDLDASALMIPIVGFLPADDPRIRATIHAIQTRLTDKGGLVYRYLSHDGLEGQEGTFLLCTFWLAQVLAMAGRVDEAKGTFSRATSFANDLGLLSEEVNPDNGELLGNFPQAFSHVGLVNAAWAISQAEERAKGKT